MCAFRFHPPPVELGAELRWVLLRAFGPLEAPVPAAVDLGAAVALAGTLALAARIGARARRAPEVAAAPAVAESLARASTMAAVTLLQAREAAVEVAAAAAEEGLACCLLKGVALEASGVLLAGSRLVGDVDVLVPEAGASRLASRLAARGFRPGAGEEYPHHLAPLLHPRLGLVEVHRHLPGVAVRGERRFATFEDLAAAGLLVPCEEVGGAMWLPARPVLVAHALAHGLAQHGFRPDAYPPLRLLADLVDLGVAGEGGAELVAGVVPLVERWVPEVEVQAAAAVCRALAAGRLDDLSGDTPAALLLRHLLAGALDERYREALKLADLAHPLVEGSRIGGWWRAVWGAMALSPAQLSRVYGKPSGPWGYLGRWLLRPFDLGRRGARALLATRKDRRAKSV
jgi:hypothetical protein